MNGLGQTQIRHGFGQTTSSVGNAALVLVGTIAAFTVGGVVNAATDGYFHGREKKKGITYKTIAKRNAALGGAIGAIAAGLLLANSN